MTMSSDKEALLPGLANAGSSYPELLVTWLGQDSAWSARPYERSPLTRGEASEVPPLAIAAREQDYTPDGAVAARSRFAYLVVGSTAVHVAMVAALLVGLGYSGWQIAEPPDEIPVELVIGVPDIEVLPKAPEAKAVEEAEPAEKSDIAGLRHEAFDDLRNAGWENELHQLRDQTPAAVEASNVTGTEIHVAERVADDHPESDAIADIKQSVADANVSIGVNDTAFEMDAADIAAMDSGLVNLSSEGSEVVAEPSDVAIAPIDQLTATPGDAAPSEAVFTLEATVTADEVGAERPSAGVSDVRPAPAGEATPSETPLDESALVASAATTLSEPEKSAAVVAEAGERPLGAVPVTVAARPVGSKINAPRVAPEQISATEPLPAVRPEVMLASLTKDLPVAVETAMAADQTHVALTEIAPQTEDDDPEAIEGANSVMPLLDDRTGADLILRGALLPLVPNKRFRD